jgi:hypothetical protein
MLSSVTVAGAMALTLTNGSMYDCFFRHLARPSGGGREDTEAEHDVAGGVLARGRDHEEVFPPTPGGHVRRLHRSGLSLFITVFLSLLRPFKTMVKSALSEHVL